MFIKLIEFFRSSKYLFIFIFIYFIYFYTFDIAFEINYHPYFQESYQLAHLPELQYSRHFHILHMFY